MRSPHVAVTSLVLLLTSVACGGDDDGGGAGDGGPIDAAPDPDGAPEVDAAIDPDAAPSPYSVHIVERDCAPDDGPALTLKLGNAVDAETCTVGGDSGVLIRLTVNLDEFAVSPPATFTFDDGADCSGSYCPSGKLPCQPATSGELHIDSFTDGAAATGTWRLDTDGETLEGGFSADWCGEDPICG